MKTIGLLGGMSWESLQDVALPLFPTARLHAEAAVALALEDG